MHEISRKETNLMYGGPLFPSFEILLVYFDRVFFSTLLLYQRETSYQMLECVLAA